MIPNRVRRRRTQQHKTSGHLLLVPFIDMLTVLVVFLLLHTADVEILPNTKNISIPQSVSEIKPRETLVVLLTRDMLFVDGKPVATMAEIQATEGNLIPALKEALGRQGDRVLRTAAIRGTDEDVASREVTIMGDKSTPYSVLKKVMATCTAADFGKVSLAVFEKERTAPAGAGATA
ncbi:MAG: biopolymer transporter ExbD [Gammaproteobacteria bacterium]